MRTGSGAFGFSAATREYVGLVDAGIIDPVKVVRLALENAVSVAGVLPLTDATMTEVVEGRSLRSERRSRSSSALALRTPRTLA